MPQQTEQNIKNTIANAKAGHGLRFDQGKLRYDLVPQDALEGMVKVLSLGAEKYGERNWENGMKWMRCVGSLFRHMALWLMGEDFDKETGLSHLDHVSCNAFFLSAYSKRGIGADDRVKTLRRPQRSRAKAKVEHLAAGNAKGVEAVQK